VPWMQVESLLERIATWAASREDVRAVALVGSWARGTAVPDSDVDLIVLADDPGGCADDPSWLDALGVAGPVRVGEWGPLSERRGVTPEGVEVEVCFGPPAWAATDPVDPGTARVVADGLRVVHDPGEHLAALLAAVKLGGATGRPARFPTAPPEASRPLP